MSERPSENAGAKNPSPPQTEIRRPTRLRALALYLIAAAGLTACSLLLPDGIGMAGANLIYYGLFFAVPVALTMRKTGIEAFRPNPISLRGMIAVILLAMNGVLFADNVTVLWAIPFQKLGLNVDAVSVAVPTNARGLVVSILIVAVLPAVCEEFLFRGAILSAFEANGTRYAILFSTVLFALLHGSLIGLPAQFIVGLIIAFVVVCTDSVYAGVIYHTVHNAASLIMQFVQQRSITPEDAQVTDYFTAIGGVGGIFTLLVEMILGAAVMLMLLRLFRMRAMLRKVPIQPENRAPLKISEWAVLLGAAVCIAGLYITDVWMMLGGGA